MGNYFSFGEYNKFYKYMWIYLALKLFIGIVLNYGLIFDQIKIKYLQIQYGPLITMQFGYITYIIVSLIILIITKNKKKEEIQKDLSGIELIYNIPDIEFGKYKSDYFFLVNIFLAVISDIIQESLNKFKCGMFGFWMFDMLFIHLIGSRLLKIKIYKHHKYSLLFILFSCSILQTIVIILNFTNDTENVKIFHNRKWLIPIMIIVNLFMNIFNAYIFSIEKYYFEKRVIPINLFILFYGIFGIITTSIFVIITTYVPCGNDTVSDLVQIICDYDEDKNAYYFASYSIYFKKFDTDYLGWRIIIEIIHSLVYYVNIYYCFVIYQLLNPINQICMHRFHSLIISILFIINDLINNDNITNFDIISNVLSFTILLFFLAGTIVYLEFIELNFCELNFYVKRNIQERADGDNLFNLYDINSEGSIEEAIE